MNDSILNDVMQVTGNISPLSVILVAGYYGSGRYPDDYIMQRAYFRSKTSLEPFIWQKRMRE